jgi:hypothetical protein
MIIIIIQVVFDVILNIINIMRSFSCSILLLL